ncbi:MAG TPA: lamin tail domain-containing protein [Verrucomicrobiae bacterium]|nr:lamin tail domain-containing protein [Verrucomicrobiae bacterium]
MQLLEAGVGDTFARVNPLGRWLGCLVATLLLGFPGIFSARAVPLIAEFMASNATTLGDEDGDFSDWIEILNPDAAAANLNGWFLTDDSALPAKWMFPSTNLPPGGRLVVFASGKNRRLPGKRLHTNFQLSTSGEFLALVQPNGILASSFSSFSKQKTDVSYGRVDDGATNDFLATPTPGKPNSAAAEFVADTRFSQARGFYETNFSLSISCATAGASIYFTTNGSSPSATNGVLYSAPIAISGTTIIRARAEKPGAWSSDVDTQTYIFLGDVILQSTNGLAPPGWPAKWGDNKVDYGMDPDIVKKSPWSGTISNDLRAIPTLSLVMRLADLFDARTGIYANADGEGPDWERPCSLELIYPDGRAGIALRAGARIRGGFSRGADDPKHSFRFLAREQYGADKLRFPLFGPTGAAEFDRFDLRTSQDGSWAFQGDPNGLFLPDPFARDTLLAVGQPGERGDWYHLYINGQYWGLYNTCERPEANFASSYFGGSPDDWDVLKPDPQEGYVMKVTDGDDGAWTRLWQAATNGFASNASYFRVQGRNTDGTPNPAFENLLEVTNLVDYLLVIFWIGDYDGPLYGGFQDGFLNNYYTFRDRNGGRGGFRFVTHDAELSLGDVNENRISTTTIGDPSRGDGPERLNPYYLWTELLPNAEFKTLVGDRVQKHFFGSGALTRDACTARFAARTNEIYRAITGESARWGDAQRPTSPITPNSWRTAIRDKMANYFPYRAGIVLDQLRDAGVFPSLGAPAFAREGGEVPNGFALALSHTNAAGEIFYTIDGSDPRAVGGAFVATAVTYDVPLIIRTSTLVRARVKDGASWSPLVEASYFPAQDFSGLRVTEIHYNPPGSGGIDGDEFEFLELKNTGANALDLGGATFTGIAFTFTNGSQLAPGAFFLLGRDAAAFTTRYPSIALDGIYAGKLDNAGERITLQTAADSEILSVSYGDRAPWPVASDGFGFSLVPVSPSGAVDPDDGRQWRASANPGGSPGRDDPTPSIPLVVINEILAHSVPPDLDQIELYNPTTAPVNLGGWFLTDDPGEPWKFRIPDGTIITPRGYLAFAETMFNSGTSPFSLSSLGEEIYLFSGSPGTTNLTGYSHGFKFGPSAASVSFGRYLNGAGEEFFPPQVATTFGQANAGPRVGPVVINEIHYHPATNYDEYIELLNITPESIDLFDPAHPTNTWRINGLGFEFPPQTTLAANGLALVVGLDPQIFRAKYAVPSNVPIFGPFAGKLQDSGEWLELQRPDPPATNGVISYIVVDDVRYNDRAPWPVAADGDGPALQRLNSSAFGNEPTNWFASGLTPGRPNHLNQLPAVSLTSPVNDAEFTLPTTIQLEAQAADADGTVTKVEFFDGAVRIGEVTNAPYRMIWATPGTGTRQLSVKAHDNELGSSVSAPVSVTIHPPIIGSGFGLRADYFSDLAFGSASIRRVDPTIDFTWTDQPWPGIPADGFTVRWTGRIQALVTGPVTFYTLSADGVRLWISGTKLIDNWTDHAETEDSATINFQSGQLYDLKLEYYNAGGKARVQLAWSAPGLARQPVPTAQLYPPLNALNQTPAVSLSSPADQSGFPAGNIAFRVNAFDSDGAIYKVRYYTNGAFLGESSNPPFNLTWPAPRGSHTITAVATDDSLVNSTSAPITVHVVSGYTTNEILIPMGSSWKYWDRGSLQASNWTLAAYNDSGWSNGPAQLGYGDGDEATVVSFGPDSNNKYVTTYFRRSFNVSTPETITGLRFRIIRDDGPVIYLNGVELFRDNLPDGPLSYDTLALTAFGPPDESIPISTNVPSAALASGPNLLACEMHQGALDSSDISFDLELTAIRGVLAPYIVTQPANVSGAAGAAMKLSVAARGAPPLNYQWQFGGVDLPGASSATLTLESFNSASAGAYTVLITNPLGSATSSPAIASLSDGLAINVDLQTGSPRLSFQPPAGRSSRIESATNLVGAWTTVTNFPAAPVATKIQFPINLPRRSSEFFRLVLP